MIVIRLRKIFVLITAAIIGSISLLSFVPTVDANVMLTQCAACNNIGNTCVEISGYQCASQAVIQATCGGVAPGYEDYWCFRKNGEDYYCAALVNISDKACGNRCIRVTRKSGGGGGGGTPTSPPPVTTPWPSTPPPTYWPTPTPPPPPPYCTPEQGYNTCQPSEAPTKFRTRPVSYSCEIKTAYPGGWQCSSQSPCSCGSSISYSSYVRYYNNSPSCSISLDRTSVTREDAPINMNLTVTDADYGDTVEITGYRVENHCALIRTTGGASLSNGIVVKLGSDSPGYTMQNNQFVINQQIAHGVYTGNPSLCQARVVIEIRDRIGEAGDTQDIAQCSATFTVRNEAPQLTGVELYDRDPVNSLRRPGNLVNGSAAVWVSSQDFNARPAQCNSPVDVDGNPPTDCDPETPIVTKTNPFEFFFTVRDGNGARDINYGGIWLQRSDIPNGANAPVYPVVSGGSRTSITAMYSDYSDRFISNGFHWITRADLNANLATGTNRFSGMRIGGSGTGNSSSPFRSSLYREWQIAGFPDCLETSYGCQTSNIPPSSQGGFGGNAGNYHDYLWDVVSNTNNYICYDNSLSPRVTSTCDNSCAACIRRSQTNAIQQVDNNTVKFGFEIQANETLGEGRYSILLMADDKVGVGLNAGPQWGAFTRNGAYCTNCGANQFVLGIDKSFPTYTTRFREGIGDEIYADVANITDNLSGYAGLYRIIYYKQDPEGIRTFLTNAGLNCQYNGQQNCYTGPTPQSGFTFLGYGVRGKDIVHAYVCLYDVAGNGGCRRDDMNPEFVAQANWMKTSMGSIYSNVSSSSASAFSVQMPSNPPNTDQSLADDILYAPYFNSNLHDYSFTNSAYISAAIAPGISGGQQNQQGGVQGFYRRLDAAHLFNRTGIIDNSGTRIGSGGWYARILSIANYNCPGLRNLGTTSELGVNNRCHTFTESSASMLQGRLGDASSQNKIIILNLPNGIQNVNTDLTCRNTNIIFIASGTLAINGQLRKSRAGLASDACVFVVNEGATLQIGDLPESQSLAGTTEIDRFEAGVIADGNFITELGTRGSNGKFDQLQIHGFVYAAKTTPLFLRDLVFSENRQLPSEWIIYDAQMNDALRSLLGVSRYSDLRCGASSHPVCEQ